MLAFAGEYRTDFYHLNRRLINSFSLRFGDFLTSPNENFACCGMDNIVNRHTTKDTFIERRDDFIAIFKCATFQTAQRSAIFFGNNHIMRNINQTTSEVSRIGCFHRCVGQTFTCTMRRDEVFEHRHTLLKVRENWVFNNLLSFCTSLLRLGHQSTHTRKLLNLVFRTTGS